MRAATTLKSFRRLASSTPLVLRSASAMTTAETSIHPRAEAVLAFWLCPNFRTAPDSYIRPDKTLWYKGGPEVDAEITANFGFDLQTLASGAYDTWLLNPYELLAGVILIDQFSRNIHRGKPQAFALDVKGLTWARHALDSGKAKELPIPARVWLYMPFMHSESLADQQRCIDEATAAVKAMPGDESYKDARAYLSMVADYGERHRLVIEKWGRFPHRNAILGRASTPEEEAGLADGSIAGF